MASPTSPTHGKDAAIYRLRPNGFVGQGLNDGVWSTSGYDGAASTYLEVVIDGEDAPDTFKWRQDGGAWTEDVAITGAAQEIADGITITFGATTGHTEGDSWAVGWLDGEGCSESGSEAQITAAARRVLDPNHLPTFTDTGSKTAIEILHAEGKAVFNGAVTVVTVDGRYIPAAALELVGYLIGWEFTATMELAEASRCGVDYREAMPGQLSTRGSAEGHLIVCDTFWDAVQAGFDGTREVSLLKLYGYDPDQDATGDQWLFWAHLNGFSAGTNIGETVKERISFQGDGAPAFVANT